MEQAIQKAIEGGYSSYAENVARNQLPITEAVKAVRRKDSDKKILLDPLFWQALGKAEGWGEVMTLIDEKGHPKEWCYYQHCDVCGEIVLGEGEECPNDCQTENAPMPSWTYHWHDLIDHLASGKDSDSYFKELLKDNK